MIRRATDSDAEDLARIYNQAMKQGVYATSQLAPVTREDRLSWLAEHQDPYPAFVYEIEDGKVIAWCSLNKFSVRPEYKGIAEISRYVDENHRQAGLGKVLLAHLIETANNLGHRALVSRAFEKNIGSRKSAAHFGFREVALLHETSCVRGEWLSDVLVWKKLP